MVTFFPEKNFTYFIFSNKFFLTILLIFILSSDRIFFCLVPPQVNLNPLLTRVRKNGCWLRKESVQFWRPSTLDSGPTSRTVKPQHPKQLFYFCVGIIKIKSCSSPSWCPAQGTLGPCTFHISSEGSKRFSRHFLHPLCGFSSEVCC